MIRYQGKEIDHIHMHDKFGRHVEISYVRKGENTLWELIIGFIFTKDGYSLQTKDGYIIKCKDQ